MIGVVTDSPITYNKRLLFAEGYLVDCGSAVSVTPPTVGEKSHPKPTGHNLVSANGRMANADQASRS